ncbi:hypothetical protein ACFZB2_39705, partial [Streptomyces bobili]
HPPNTRPSTTAKPRNPRSQSQPRVSIEPGTVQTVSRKKVVAAVLGWVKGEPDWKVAFKWNSIAACFEDNDSG